MRPGRRLLALGAGLVSAVGISLALRRSGLAVHLIRGIDQRLELFSPRGARAYARHAPRLLAGLHRAVVADARTKPPPIEVVDVGCGPGDLLEALAAAFPMARVVGIDPSEAMREVAHERLVAAGLVERVTLLNGSAEQLPLADGSADIIVSTLSAHHWSDPAAAFREIRRCLAPGGEARIYDVRFAAFTPHELDDLALAAGLDLGDVERRVVEVRIGPFRPFAVATIHAGGATSHLGAAAG